MKISYNWLNEYVNHSLSPESLADALTMSGLEVEGIEIIGASMEGIMVGHVLETSAHPNADRLTLCRVDLGVGDPVQIVCGAPNVAAGQHVPVATVNTTLMLPDRNNPTERVAVKLKKAKIRGELSFGMICAEDELGLSDDHAGIMVLDTDASVGQPFADYLKARGRDVQDAVLDVSITPNRPDAISHIGVARDVGALQASKLILPAVHLPPHGGEAAHQVTVKIEAPEACGRYAALLVRGVKIQPSPLWLQQRLTAIGLRPRNNVVDITNFVMHECGQPLHAFDYDQIADKTIIVRLTQEETPFTTLDSKERLLPKGTLMIADGARDVAIAGVMGGENSEVTGNTTNVLIESAYFDPSSIRKTAKALQLQTDASYRFERGVDPEGQVWAAARAAQLMVSLGGGSSVPGLVDAHPVRTQQRTVSVRISRIEHVLGIAVPQQEAVRLLEAIGFDVAIDNAVLRCTVPTYRPDVAREIDVIEEVARLFGYDRIPEPAHTVIPNETPHERPVQILRSRALDLLRNLGYREIYTNSMLRHETAEAFDQPVLRGLAVDGGVVQTLNPISQEMAALRPNLLPGLLQVLAHNQNHGQRLLRFAEFGHVFNRATDGATLIPGYAEHASLIVALSGPQEGAGWDRTERAADFFDLKGVMEALLEALHLPSPIMQPVYDATPVTAYHLTLSAGGVPLGLLAQLSATVATSFGLKDPVYFAVLNWDYIVELAAPRLAISYRPISRFPVVERDLAVVVGRDQPVGPMEEAIRTAGAPLLQGLSVFDLYEGDRIAQDRKSVAFGLRFGSDRTLQDAEVDTCIAHVLAALVEKFGAELRA